MDYGTSISDEKGPETALVAHLCECNPDFRETPEGYDDMVNMTVMNEAEIINNINIRYV